MLPSINRIKKKKDFEVIFKGAQGASYSFKNNLFVLRAVKNNLELVRFGFVVSQKVSKKAVLRNKARRRLSEAATAELKNIKNGTDIVLIALSGIEKKEFSEIKDSLSGALAKTRLLTQK